MNGYTCTCMCLSTNLPLSPYLLLLKAEELKVSVDTDQDKIFSCGSESLLVPLGFTCFGLINIAVSIDCSKPVYSCYKIMIAN